MAGVIAVLPGLLADKIRAGEVVQRPESVVKELVENSIDAQAAEIRIIITGAGKNLICVIDNGIGMSAEDASMAFQHHATSKIHSFDDLERIRTLGFRGEALPSIASVSHVEIRTRRAADELAAVVRMEGGEPKETFADAGPVGTSLSVRHLFYNTPARRHFLKSDQTESKHCIETVYRLALAHPNIAFHVTMGEETVIDAPAADLITRIEQLFGTQFASSHVFVQEQADEFSIEGYISQPSFSRRTRSEQYLFLNGRYFQSKTLQYAVHSSYEHVLIKGNFPSYALFMTMDPKHADVNVHPQKLEIKFENERSIYSALNAIVKKGLTSYSLIPDIAFAGSSSDIDVQTGMHSGAAEGEGMLLVQGGKFDSMRNFRVNTDTGEILQRDNLSGGDAPFRQSPRSYDAGSAKNEQMFDGDIRALFTQSPELEFPREATQSEATHEFHHDMLRSDVANISGGIWQLHNKYILAQIRNGMIIVDQHVAHERVLYEKTLSMLAANAPFSQQLLFPCTIEMSPADIAFVKEILSDLQGIGFVIRFFGKNTVVIDAVPHDVKQGSEINVFMELIARTQENGQMPIADMRDHIVKTFACKAAIKAGDALKPEEMNSLIDHLFATQMPYVCPHGRPIVVKVALEELDRRFGRPVP